MLRGAFLFYRNEKSVFSRHCFTDFKTFAILKCIWEYCSECGRGLDILFCIWFDSRAQLWSFRYWPLGSPGSTWTRDQSFLCTLVAMLHVPHNFALFIRWLCIYCCWQRVDKFLRYEVRTWASAYSYQKAVLQ